jgi:dUTP pyrophosphatase
MSIAYQLNFLTDESLYDTLKITHKGDSGFDLFFPDEITFSPGETKLVDLKIKCQMFDPSDSPRDSKLISYDLRARSSIYKTPLRIANSAGLIDSGYTGNIKVALDNIKDYEYTITRGQSLVQIVSGDLKPIIISRVESLIETERGNNGFGSTNK